MNKQEIIKALEEAKKTKRRNFDQSIDLIINLKKFDINKNAINEVVNLPHKVKDKKICGFFNEKNELVDTITKKEFGRYEDKKKLKKLIKKYDAFIASASLMPAVATSFGRVLGPAGKMPSPKLGVLMKEDVDSVSKVVKKINSSVVIKTKEPTIKIAIGKQSMKNEDIADNIMAVYNVVFNALPYKKQNIKSIMVKLTMGKPIKIKEDEAAKPESNAEEKLINKGNKRKNDTPRPKGRGTNK